MQQRLTRVTLNASLRWHSLPLWRQARKSTSDSRQDQASQDSVIDNLTGWAASRIAATPATKRVPPRKSSRPSRSEGSSQTSHKNALIRKLSSISLQLSYQAAFTPQDSALRAIPRPSTDRGHVKLPGNTRKARIDQGTVKRNDELPRHPQRVAFTKKASLGRAIPQPTTKPTSVELAKNVIAGVTAAKMKSKMEDRVAKARKAFNEAPKRLPTLVRNPKPHAKCLSKKSLDFWTAKLAKARKTSSKAPKSLSTPVQSLQATTKGLSGGLRPATLQEAEHDLRSRLYSRLRLKTTSQPYSLPEPRKFIGKTESGLRHLYDKMDYEQVPAATWYAEEAVRPLLLTFDAFGTLFEPREPIERQYCEVASRYGLKLDESAVKESFAKAYKAQLARHPNYGRTTGLDPRSWWTEIIEQTVIPYLPRNQRIPSALAGDLYGRFSSSEGYRLFNDVFDLLTLIGTSYQAGNWPPRRTMLGIVSNSDPRVGSILGSFGIEIYPSMFPPRFTPESIAERPDFGPAHFAFATLSYVHGNAKPSPAIYGDALVDAQRALDGIHTVGRLTRSGNKLLENINADFHHMHVGDDWEKDIVPAIQKGFDAVLIDRSAKKALSERDLDGRKVPVINDLTVIRELLTAERTKEQSGQDNRRPVPLQPRGSSNLHGRSLKPHPAFPEGDIMTLE